MVILANENRRQIPKSRNIQSLKQLPLVRRTVTIQSKSHKLLLGILLSESQTTPQRNLSANDPMSAVETRVLLVKMHRPSFPVRASPLPPHQLRERVHQLPSAPQERAVVPVRRDDRVLPRDRRLHPHGQSLLPVVEVAEPADQFGLVERVRGDLHAPHASHVAEEGEDLRRGGLHGARRRVAEVGLERDGGFDRDGGCVCGDVAADGGR